MQNCTKWCAARVANTNRVHFVPADLTWLSDNVVVCDSNGLAAGETRVDAERSALLELIERDAVAIWWYNKCSRPGIPLQILREAQGIELQAWLEARTPRRTTWLLDLTHDFHVPVVAAISADPQGTNLAYGFASRQQMGAAALAAVLEMLQSEISLRLAARREILTGSAGGPAGRYLVWSRSTSVRDLPCLWPCKDALVSPVLREGDLADLIGRIGPHPALFVDLDRPGDQMRVVRAMVPGLRPWRPRFAPGRLFDVPNNLGWTRAAFNEAEVGDQVILI
jgi:ribosomal protein S12 methylthiotransferase accessory factor